MKTDEGREKEFSFMADISVRESHRVAVVHLINNKSEKSSVLYVVNLTTGEWRQIVPPEAASINLWIFLERALIVFPGCLLAGTILPAFIWPENYDVALFVIGFFVGIFAFLPIYIMQRFLIPNRNIKKLVKQAKEFRDDTLALPAS